MTEEEYKTEFDCAYQTRLNDLCPFGEPTPAQKQIAFDEAERHEKELKAHESRAAQE